MNQAINVSMDGSDPDNLATRPVRRIGGSDWQWCQQAVEDHKELELMTPAELHHYAGTPSFSQKAKSRGANGY